jgi:hypothetical protein
MPALAPCIRLFDAPRTERLDRRADPFTSGRDLDERRSGATVETARIEPA